jgi:hypothetical protein
LDPEQKSRLKKALLTFCLSTGNKGAFWGAQRRGLGGKEVEVEGGGEMGGGEQTGKTKEGVPVSPAEAGEKSDMETGEKSDMEAGEKADMEAGAEAELESRIDRVLCTSSLTPRELQALLHRKYGKVGEGEGEGSMYSF